MKIFSVPQLKDADNFTISNEPIASIDLMERAAKACTNWLIERYDTSVNIKIVCGLGNNGGDGLAIARLLSEQMYNVEVYLIKHSEKQSEDFTKNLQRFETLYPSNVHNVTTLDMLIEKWRELNNSNIFIDAVLGSGLNKPVVGLIADVVNFINRIQLPVIAIDLPTGMYGDELNGVNDVIVKADFVLTFQFPKLSFMLPEMADYIGEFSVLDIGISDEFINHSQTPYYFITKSDVQLFFKTRSKAAHKGTFGHALIIAGAYGKMGAAVLSTKACIHSGVGLLTAQIPKCGYTILQSTNPETMLVVDGEDNFITEAIKLDKYNAVGIGPGIGLEKQTQNVVKQVIQNALSPIVFDADAINCLAENKTWLSFVPANSIFTPHVKEFERIAGKSDNSIERLKLLREFAIKHGIYVVLKGAHTAIGCPDGTIVFNSTGNPGMATGGSGDVLTGIITSLCAQGYNSYQACVLGVYLHGLAGDFAALDKSEEAMIASDIIEHLSNAFQFIKE